MIYVTGDIHADLDRFKGKEAKKLKKGDTLIVCGDFGFVWDGSKKEQQVLKWIGKQMCIRDRKPTWSKVMSQPWLISLFSPCWIG